MRRVHRAFLAPCIGLSLAGTAIAGPFEDGYAAYERKDYAVALQYWRPAAAQGNADAQNNLGSMYKHGLGVVVDYAEALRWYRMSAMQGNDHGQTNVGIMYDTGLGVAKDPVEAVKWYQLAAAQGNTEAKLWLMLKRP